MEEQKELKIVDKFKLYIYYVIIGIVSFLSLVFLPMIGTQGGLAWNVPNTFVGWLIWIVIKLIIAAINIIIFHSFMQQAKVNVRDNPKYKEALEILGRIKLKNYIPRSPEKWNARQYGVKGVSIFLTTCLATVAFTQAILTFDWIAMISYLFTIIMGIIFGIIQMKIAEEYWTDEFWKYAKMVEAQYEAEVNTSLEVAKKECAEQRDDSVCTNSGTIILESGTNSSPSSNTN